jgi:DNA-binding SARP family transcriptional activator/Tfp pilus assembly protein PilF
MRFQVLGPICVDADGHQVAISAGRERILLAMLLLHAGRTVSTDQLVDAIWDEEVPHHVRNQLQTCIHRIRRRLDEAGRDQQLIVTEPGGYRITMDPEDLDLYEFRRLVGEARALAAAGNHHDAKVTYRSALDLWRGPAFAGIDSNPIRAAAASLDEERIQALEECLDTELAAGGAGELVAELTDLVAQHPHRERLHRALMLALYRAGRQADALAAYRHARQLLQDDLGTEPGTDLQELHKAILNRDADLGPRRPPAPAPPMPRELPADVQAFTGREDELARITKVLAAVNQPGPVVISAIDGAGGVGKSALALHAAHLVADQFPDGQLYVDLQGATAGLVPLSPLEVLGRFLRALGVPDNEVPDQVDEAAARFRSQVAGRRLLVVLDNAADQAQVRPLLPGTPGCGVLVTSRRSLSGLGGASPLWLGLLSEAESVALLGRLVGAERVAAEPQAAEEIARCCGYLPLALRIAAARLVDRPTWPMAWLARRLTDTQHRLDELELADVGVRAGLAVAHDHLTNSDDPVDRAAAEAYSLLGVWDGPQLSVAVAARLLDQPERDTELVLERLVDARLLDTPAPGRYQWHDLLRLYAREEAAARFSEPQRTAAIARLLRFYVATAWHCCTLLRPGDYRPAWIEEHWRTGGAEPADADAAVAWLETERANLLAAIAQATATTGLAATVAPLAYALFGFLFDRHHLWDLAQVNRLALAAARRTGSRAGQASALHDLGVAYERLERYNHALGCYRRSLAIREELEDHIGMGTALQHLGEAYGRLGRYDEALATLRRSLTINRQVGNRTNTAHNLLTLGMTYVELDRCQEARDCVEQALEISRKVGDPISEERGHNGLGTIYMRLGRYREAHESIQRSLTMSRKAGHRWREAEGLYRLGTIHHAEQQYAEALDCLRQSLAICRELRHRDDEAEVLRETGVTLRSLGRVDEARSHWQEALSILEELRLPAADNVRALLADTDPRPPAATTQSPNVAGNG